MKYDYSHPVKDKLPSPISQLGLIVKALDYANYQTPDQIFRQAFRPHDNKESFKTLLYICRRRNWMEKEFPDRLKPNRYRLTDEGKTVKEALKNVP